VFVGFKFGGCISNLGINSALNSKYYIKIASCNFESILPLKQIIVITFVV